MNADTVWKALRHSSFAVIGHVTPAGEPRSSGVIYLVRDGVLRVAVGKDSWKARHIAARPRVSVTVPVRRGGLLSLLLPIPPATVSFAADVTVLPGELLETRLAPAKYRDACVLLEIRPVGHFLTYGIGVPLMRMADRQRSRHRVAV